MSSADQYGVTQDSAERIGRVRIAKILVLVVTDAGALCLAGSAAYLCWARPFKHQPISLYVDLLPLVLVFLFGYGQAGLYASGGVGPVETLRRCSYVTAFSYFVLASISFILKLPPLYSRVTYALAFTFSLVIVPTARAVVTRVIDSLSDWNEPVVVVVESSESAVRILRSLKLGGLGYRAAAVLCTAPLSQVSTVEGVSVLPGFTSAAELARRGTRVALVGTEQTTDRRLVDRLLKDFRHVVVLREFSELPLDRVKVRSLGSVVGLEDTTNLLRKENRLAKRAIDVVLASLALLFTAPLVAAALVCVWLADGAPLFYGQSRLGRGNRRIRVPKVRTMRRDAAAALIESLKRDPSLRQEWQERHKLRNDPRLIPGAGRILRRFSIDELPQLWSVLRGDMSLVGPRPFPDYHLAKFSPEFVDLRHRVRPGITGLWQITVRSEGGIDEQEAWDSYYIRNWSVWLDIYILSRTLQAVVRGRGAY